MYHRLVYFTESTRGGNNNSKLFVKSDPEDKVLMEFPLVILDIIDNKIGYSNDSLAELMPNPGK